MRLLSLPEIKSVAGGDTTNVAVNVGNYQLQITPLSNGTITVGLLNGSSVMWTWNSGVAASCAAVGLGVGLMSLAFTGGNGVAASFIGRAAAFGCNAYIEHTTPPPPYNGDDGDG